MSHKVISKVYSKEHKAYHPAKMSLHATIGDVSGTTKQWLNVPHGMVFTNMTAVISGAVDADTVITLVDNTGFAFTIGFVELTASGSAEGDKFIGFAGSPGSISGSGSIHEGGKYYVVSDGATSSTVSAEITILGVQN